MERDNQSQYEYQMNTGRYPMREVTHNFSPEVHVLTGMLVPVVSTTHLVVRELIGTTPSPSLGRRKNLPEVRVTQCQCFINQTSKLIRLPCCFRKTMVASNRHEDLYWFRPEPYI